MKTCTKCNQEKQLTEFNKRRSECKLCQKEVDRQWRINNRARHKELQKQYRETHLDYFKQYNKEYRIKNGDKVKSVINKLRNAIPAGVYMIKNQITGECYVGQSTKPYQRRIQHFSIHANPNTKYTVKKLQSAMKQYGPDSFVFGIIEHCEPEQLLERERYYINQLNPEYNLA